MITRMPAAYLRIVCAKITSTGKFSVQEIFSFNGEKFLCANFFTEKQINEHVARKKSPEKTRGNGAEKPGKDRLRSISNQLAHSWGKVQTLNYATESPHCLPGKLMSREFRHILRFMGTDLDGSKKVIYGISKIRGVGPNLAQAVVKVAKVNPDARIGALSEAEMSRVEDAIRDPLKHGIPPRMVNRRKDIETGRDMHLVGPDLVLKIKSDVDLMKDIRSWKGVRHSLGLKVRGQRTRTTGRSGKAVGVKKKVLMEAARAAQRKPAEEKK